MNAFDHGRCRQSEITRAVLARALDGSEEAQAKAHIASCPQCREEVERLRPILEGFAAWPRDILSPTAPLQERLAHRIAADTGKAAVMPPARTWSEPAWEQVAP